MNNAAQQYEQVVNELMQTMAQLDATEQLITGESREHQTARSEISQAINHIIAAKREVSNLLAG